MRRSSVLMLSLTFLLASSLAARQARAQAPTIDTGTTSGPGSGSSSLGSAPGSGGSSLGSAPGAGGGQGVASQATPLSGRAGPTVPRVPSSITTPEAALNAPDQRGVASPVPLPVSEAPAYGSVALPTTTESEGPPSGMTLDQAIDRLVRENPDLRSKFFEVSMAESDVLTASLRANPIFYADTQLVPYGQYSNVRPGGPLQYDVNITYPFDITHKRQARTDVARKAKRVIEAQYQDAVRQQIDNLYTAYVDVLAARLRVQYAEASVKGNSELYEKAKTLLESGEQGRAYFKRTLIQLQKSRLGLVDAQASLLKTKRTLGVMLNMTPDESESMDVRGSVIDRTAQAPEFKELVKLALEERPDVVAYRLGLQRAEADVVLARRSRIQDVYMLYQPYTFQNNEPFGTKSATSWALGVTVPLPIYNRNQGVIQRAQTNVTQTMSELDALQRQVINDVTQAEREYRVSLEAVKQVEETILPPAKSVLDDTLRFYQRGEFTVIQYLEARRDYNETVQQYLETLVRHRRSMLDLNTALGKRILP